MKFLAEIDIMPHKELLDPQGKTVAKNLHHIPVDQGWKTHSSATGG